MHFATRKDTKEEPLVTQELHANCLELVVVALYYNPPLTLSILQKSNVLQEFFRQWFSKLSSFTRVHDRKVCILAISNMLSSVPAEIISMAGLPNQLLKAAVNLFEGLPKALERRAELEEEFGKDDDDEDDDDESEAEEDDDLDGGDEDDVYDDDNAYQELLAAKQVRRTTRPTSQKICMYYPKPSTDIRTDRIDSTERNGCSCSTGSQI